LRDQALVTERHPGEARAQKWPHQPEVDRAAKRRQVELCARGTVEQSGPAVLCDEGGRRISQIPRELISPEAESRRGNAPRRILYGFLLDRTPPRRRARLQTRNGTKSQNWKAITIMDLIAAISIIQRMWYRRVRSSLSEAAEGAEPYSENACNWQIVAVIS